MCEYYDSDVEPENEPQPLELVLAVEIDQAADQLEDVADDLRKASRLTQAQVEMNWRVGQMKRRS